VLLGLEGLRRSGRSYVYLRLVVIYSQELLDRDDEAERIEAGLNALGRATICSSSRVIFR
jgi:hypothetical protein